MNVEKKPLTKLENDKSFFNTRLKAFADFNTKLESFESSFKALNSTDKFRSYSATAASAEFFSLKATSTAKAGSYNIEVVNLARVQKTSSVGYASPTTSTFSAGTININGTEITVIDGDNLGNIVDKINQANTGETATGVSAALINDGTANGYRMVLTGKDAATAFTATATGVTCRWPCDDLLTTPQTAQQATVIIDGLTVVSNNNTLKNAIPGVELTLLKANSTGASTQMSVAVDTEGVKKKLDTFVSAYNDIIKFIADQKGSSWANDSGMQSVKRRFRACLGEAVGGDTPCSGWSTSASSPTRKTAPSRLTAPPSTN